MPVIEIITIVFAAITIYLCYDEYKKRKNEFEEFQNSFYMRKSCDFRNNIFDNLLIFKYEIIRGS